MGQSQIVGCVAGVVCLLIWWTSSHECVMNLTRTPLDGKYGGRNAAPRYATLAQLRDWNREGFLVMRNAMSPDDVGRLQTYLDEMERMPVVKGGIPKYFESDTRNASLKLLNRIEKFSDYHEGMRRFVNSDLVKGVSSDLLGGEIALFKEKVNYKLPGGGGFDPHQDMQPGWSKYAPQMVSVLLVADHNGIDNGPLEIAPGAHARPGGLIGRMHEPLNDTEIAGLKWQVLTAEPGDIVFFDAWAPHRSSPNTSPSKRRNTYVTFNLKVCSSIFPLPLK